MNIFGGENIQIIKGSKLYLNLNGSEINLNSLPAPTVGGTANTSVFKV